MNQLAKQAAEMALRLAALPDEAQRPDPEALDSIELLAIRILREVAEMRRATPRPVGETRGCWRVVQPVKSR